MAYPLTEQIKEVKLEIMFRRSTYRKMVEQGRMKEEVANRRSAIMDAVLDTLQRLAQHRDNWEALGLEIMRDEQHDTMLRDLYEKNNK